MSFPPKHDPLKCLAYLEMHRRRPSIQSKTLRIEIRFLSFAAKCWSGDSNFNDLLVRVEAFTQEARECLHNCCSSRKVIGDWKAMDSVCHQLLQKIELFKPEMRQVYNSIPQHPLKFSALINVEVLVDFAESLIENLNDMLNCKAYIVSIKKCIEALKKKLRFLSDFLCYSSERVADKQKFNYLSTHIKAVADNTANLAYRSFIEDMGENIAFSKSLKLPHHIRLHSPEVITIYTGVFKALRISQSSDCFMHEFVVCFVDFLLEDLKDILVCKDTLKLQLEHGIESLHKELRFLLHFLAHPLKQYYIMHEEFSELLFRTEILVKEVVTVINYFSVNEMNDDLMKDLDVTLFDLLQRLESMKAEARVVLHLKFPNSLMLQSNFPRTNELGFFNFLMQKLKVFLTNKNELTAFTEFQVKMIQVELEFLKSFLVDIQNHHYEHQKLNNLQKLTMDMAYKVEYCLDSLQTGACPFWSCILEDILEEIKFVRREVVDIYNQIPIEVFQDVKSSYPFSSEANGKNIDDLMVGFEDDASTIVDWLTRGPAHLDIICIVGMPGLGKTTLARKVFNDRSITSFFDICAWCNVSQQYDKKELLIEILSHIFELSDEMENMSDLDLADRLRRSLLQRRYLIVMDDVWNIEAWDDLRQCFPDNEIGSRIMLTSRLKHVALQVNPNRNPHNLRFFSKKESWKLLQEKLFQKGSCPPELSEVGEQIAEQCQGLPLYVVLIAGLLLGTEKKPECWKQVSKCLSAHIANGRKQCTDIVGLSYNHLADHLKPCFLYLGGFLEDREIRVSKLIRLWIAEGFVQKKGDKSLEDIAEGYLMDLIDRSLIIVAKRSTRDGVKACQVHDLLRDFCVERAKQENFSQWLYGHNEFPNFSSPFQGIGIDPHESFSSKPKTYDCRRLCIHSKRNHFIMARPSGPFTRTLFYFAAFDGFRLWHYDLSFIFQNFKLLRILNLGGISLHESVFANIKMLVHLRYLDIWGNFDSIPPSIVRLQNLETLLVKGCGREITIPFTFQMILSLRHMHLSSSASFGKADIGEYMHRTYALLHNLETFSTPTFYHRNQTKILKRIPRLRKLRCMFTNEYRDQFPELGFLVNLESLKVICYAVMPLACELSFPLNLKKLTLSNFRLPWKKISTIGRLPNLEVLKLLIDAFEGEQWDMKDGEFQKLKVLKLAFLDIVWWNASSDHLPCLEHLVLHRCGYLKEIPHDFGDIATLMIVEMKWCNRGAVHSIKQIHQAQINMGNEDLKVLIYPRDLDSRLSTKGNINGEFTEMISW